MKWYDRLVMYLMFIVLLVILWDVYAMDTNMRSNFDTCERALIALLTFGSQ